MPDIYTTRPDIVRQVLSDAGLQGGVQPTIIKERSPEVTFRFDGKGYYAELYVHDLSQVQKFPDVTSFGVGMLIGALIAGAVFAVGRRRGGAAAA